MAKGDTQTQQQTQKSDTTPWAPAQPLLQDLISQYSGLSTGVTGDQSAASAGLLDATKSLPNFGGAGTTAVNNLFNSSTAPQVGMLNDAYGTLQKNLGGTASGAELDPYSTPGFGGALDTLTNDITNKVKGVYAGSGRDPSGAGSFAGSLGRGLMQGEAPIIASQYNQNKANQMSAAGQLFGAGGSTAGAITGQNQVPLTNAATALGLSPGVLQAYLQPGQAQLGAANTAFQQPFGNLSELLKPAMGLGGLGQQSAGSGTSIVQQPQSTLSNIMGGASGAIGLLSLLSDERTKEEIAPIGKLNDGQDVVRFRYKGDPVMRIGLIAQDVERFAPDAVDDVGSGLLAVNHRKATDTAAAMGRAA
jgi:hypothetical protein